MNELIKYSAKDLPRKKKKAFKKKILLFKKLWLEYEKTNTKPIVINFAKEST